MSAASEVKPQMNVVLEIVLDLRPTAEVLYARPAVVGHKDYI
jgi:hypothetical protein